MLFSFFLFAKIIIEVIVSNDIKVIVSEDMDHALVKVYFHRTFEVSCFIDIAVERNRFVLSCPCSLLQFYLKTVISPN